MGFDDRDESIRAVEAELRQLLRYDGYHLVGEAVLQLREGGFGEQMLRGSCDHSRRRHLPVMQRPSALFGRIRQR